MGKKFHMIRGVSGIIVKSYFIVWNFHVQDMSVPTFRHPPVIEKNGI